MSCYFKLIPEYDNILEKSIPLMYDYVVWFFVHAMDIYVRFLYKINNMMAYFEKKSPWFAAIKTCMIYWYIRIYNFVGRIYTEPDSPPWISVSYITYIPEPITYFDTCNHSWLQAVYDIVCGDNPILCKKPESYYDFKETYVMCNECNQTTNVIDRWSQICHSIFCTNEKLLKQNTGIIMVDAPERILCTYKTASNQYIFRSTTHIKNKKKKDISWEILNFDDVYLEKLQPSTVRFLSIEYSHPKMAYSIPLELPKEMMYVGNHLFSPAFVARMLHYIVGKDHFVFDMDYTIKIMDKNLQYFELTYYQYLYLDKTMYEVKTEK
jgi:hypothetical protein